MAASVNPREKKTTYIFIYIVFPITEHYENVLHAQAAHHEVQEDVHYDQIWGRIDYANHKILHCSTFRHQFCFKSHYIWYLHDRRANLHVYAK